MIVTCTNFRHKTNEIGTNKQHVVLTVIFNPLVVTFIFMLIKGNIKFDRTASLSSSVV